MNQPTTLSKFEYKELTGEDMQEATKQIQLNERQRCIGKIRDIASVYLPMYVMERLIAAIEKEEWHNRKGTIVR